MHGRITKVVPQILFCRADGCSRGFSGREHGAIAASPEVETGLIKVGDANIEVLAPGRTQELYSELLAAGIPF